MVSGSSSELSTSCSERIRPAPKLPKVMLAPTESTSYSKSSVVVKSSPFSSWVVTNCKESSTAPDAPQMLRVPSPTFMEVVIPKPSLVASLKPPSFSMCSYAADTEKPSVLKVTEGRRPEKVSVSSPPSSP